MPINVDSIIQAALSRGLNPANTAKYGKRNDGITLKQNGYFGTLPMTNGSNGVAGEMSIGMPIYGVEQDVPSIVPTLNKDEMDHLLSGGGVTPEIAQKAFEHAKIRVRLGKSPFAINGEDQPLPYPIK